VGLGISKLRKATAWAEVRFRHLIVTLACTSISLIDTGVDAVCAIREIGAANARLGVIEAPAPLFSHPNQPFSSGTVKNKALTAV